MNKNQLPDEMKELVRKLRGELKARVEVEYLPGIKRYRMAVISDQFRNVPHLERQDRLWDIVDQVLTPEQSMSVSMILAYDPKDLQPAEQETSLL